MPNRRFAVLDRDGTIIVERHYLSDPQGVEVLPGAATGMRKLSSMGFGLVVITNQSAIGRGLFDRARLDAIHQRMRELLAAEGVSLDGIYFCPHRPDENCTCRKPKPGLLELAARELQFDPENSFVMGDKACDIELGQRAGAKTFLVRTGYGAQEARDARISPDYVVDDVADAARIIESLAAGQRTSRGDTPTDRSGRMLED